jgi:type IV secretory pathway VirD2 relaxase
MPEDLDLPIFWPRVGKRTRQGVEGRSGSFLNELRARISRNGGFRRRSPARTARAENQPNARRVVVKARYVRMTVGGAKAAKLHLRYIERDGVEQDGSKGVLYGPDGPVERRTFEEPRLGEKHQFRIIVSPEDAVELDLTIYVRDLMKRVQKDIGREVEWAAVNHHDTGHPHAHVVIRGVDRDGRELRIDRGYIAHGMRWRAQELATNELGPRRECEVRRALEREVTQDRFTSLDRELERLADGGRLQVRAPRRLTRVDPSILVQRLEHLEGLRLAERIESNVWSLSADWQKRLRDRGARGDIIKQMHDVVQGDTSRYRVVRSGEKLRGGLRDDEETLVGRVAGKGLADELKGAFYAVVETPDGFAYHLPLDSRTADSLRTGDLVRLSTRPEAAVRPVDRHIAEVARSTGGLCMLDPAADQSDRSRMERRLRELEREGLVAPHGAGRWKVAAGLIARLESRPRAVAPRERLWVEKLPLSLDAMPGHRGPVWLDEVDRAQLAGWGFGADVRLALGRRRDALRELGIEPDDPGKSARLREVERRAVGEGMAARTGHVFLAKTPEHFHGTLQVGPEGARFAVVTDGVRFIVVPASRELKTLAGRAVAVGRDAEGRLRIQGREMDRDR